MNSIHSTVIIIHPKVSRLTLANFCGFHQLTIHVHERDSEMCAWMKSLSGDDRLKMASLRYYADIPHLEVAESETVYTQSR